MLKNLSPILTGGLLRAVDSTVPGDLIALVSSGYPEARVPHETLALTDVTIESAVEAILSVFPLAVDDPSPIYSWLEDEPDEASTDIAFAVNGIACDAELRRIGMTTLSQEMFDALAVQAVVTVRLEETDAPCAFLLRKGYC
ncbi:MAG: hypothetical protein ABI255_02095 [Microbacteriaceae bacterium]